MALISSSYTFPPGLNGVLPITVPPHMPYSSTAAAAGAPPAWMRVPLHYSFPGFSPASLSAAAYLTAAPRARRIIGSSGENNELSSIISHASLSKRLALSSPPRTRRRRVTNFSIEGILGKKDDEDAADDESDDRDADERDMKMLVVDTNSSEPLSPGGSPNCLKDDRRLSPSPLNLADHHHQGSEISSEHQLHHHHDGEHGEESNPMTRFSWLQCTRYKPPRLPRAKRKEGAKKRKLGRNPRVPFSPGQVATLEQKFRCTHYLSSIDVAELSTALNLSENRVKIWFQNRRARERRDKEAADKGEVTSSSIRSPSANIIASSPSLLPSHSNSMIATTSATLLSLSANGIPRLTSSASPVGMSAFTPVTYDIKSASAAAAVLSSIHQHQSQNI